MKQETLPRPRTQRSEARSHSDTVLPAHLALTLAGGFFTRDLTLVCIEVGPLLLGTLGPGLLVSPTTVGSCTHGSRFCPAGPPASSVSLPQVTRPPLWSSLHSVDATATWNVHVRSDREETPS